MGRGERLMISTRVSTPPTVRHVLVRQQRAHPALQLLLDQPDHLRRGAVHGGDPVGDLGLLLGGEPGQHLGRLRGGQVGQHQRDDLRVLVLEEGDQLADVGVAQRGERHLGVDDVEPRQDALGLVLAQAGGQDLAGEVDAAAADEALGGHQAVELVHDAVDVVGLHRAQPHQLAGERLDLARAQLGQQDAGLLLGHLGEEDRGLAQAGQLRARGRRRDRRGRLPGPGRRAARRRDAHGSVPRVPLLTTPHDLVSLSQPRSMAATSSGRSLTIGEISPRTRCRSAASSSSASRSSTLDLLAGCSRRAAGRARRACRR